MADLAGLDLFIEHCKGFFDGNGVRVVIGIGIFADAEEVAGAIGPMQLVQVQVVGVQPAQAPFQSGDDVLAVVVRQAIADVCLATGVAGRAGDLAGQDEPVAVATGFDPVAEVALGGGPGFSAGRRGVHLGGVDEIDPGGDGGVQLLVGVLFGVLVAPGHGAEAEQADLEVGVAECAVAHWFFLMNVCWVQDPGAALQPFRDARPLLQGIAVSCRSGLVSRKGRRAPPRLRTGYAPWVSRGARARWCRCTRSGTSRASAAAAPLPQRTPARPTGTCRA